MNIKKLGASILAAAMLITSGSMSMHSAASTSDIVMISLKEYDTKITITDKTESQLDEGISIGDILDKMVYKGDQTDKDGNFFANGAGVAIPAEATVVWVGNNKYSIFERDVKVHISQYSKYDIIVGSGKQLDPNNIIYHLSADITPVEFVIDWANSDVKLYTISEDGTVKPFDSTVRSSGNSSLDLDCKKKVPHEKVAADISKLKIKLSNSADMPEYKIKFYSDYNSYRDDIELTADDQGRILFELDKPSSGSYYKSTDLYYSLCNPDGTLLEGTVAYNYAYIYTYYPYFYFYGYLGSEYIYYDDFEKTEENNSVTYSLNMDLDPGETADGMKFKFSSFSINGNRIYNDIIKAIEGNKADLASAESDDDIKDDLFSSGYGIGGDYTEGVEFTLFLDTASENVKPFLDTDDATGYAVHFSLKVSERRLYTTLDMKGGVNGTDAYIFVDSDNEGVTTDNGYSYTGKIGVTDPKSDVSYYIRTLQRKADNVGLKKDITKAVKGKFASSEAAKDAEEISVDDLFDSTKGYKVDLSAEGGEDITIFLDAAGDSPANALCRDENATEFVINLHFETVVIENVDPDPGTKPEPEYEFVDVDDSQLPPDIKNTHFNVTSISDENGTIIKTSLGLHSDDEATYFDTYGKYGSQTIFAFADDGKESIDLSKIRLNVKKDSDLRVFLIEDGKATYVDLDTETQDFSNGKPKHYATAKRREGNKYYKQGNYYVTVKTGNNATGSGLFVEGPSDQNGQQSGTRTIFFDRYYGEAYHDIVIANLGISPINNLTATLSDAKGIKLNGFWDLNGEYALAPTTVTADNSSTSTVKRVENMAKIRIEPETDENGIPKKGDISGKLTISADGQPTYVINLSGKISTPTIITNQLSDAVKFVPYSSIISVDTVHKWLTTEFSAVDDLPEGLTLNEYSGELYGVPQEAGTYRFRIRAKTSWEGNAEFTPSTITKYFTLVIKENTDENVYYASDENYTIATSIGTANNTFDFVLPDTMITEDQKFVSVGEYGDFIDFWMNGEKLEEGTDYTSEAGSTVITIKSQTLSGLAKGEANTIAAEFRVGGQLENALKRTAQNFTIKTPKPEDPGTSTPGTSGDTSGDTSSDTSTPSTSGGSGAVGSVTDPDTSSSTSTPDTSDSTSTPSESDIVFKPVHVDGELADIINGTTVTAPQGVMSKDAVLTIIADSSVPADKGTALDFTFTVNGKKVQPSGDMTVRIPIPDNLKNVSPLYVYHITDGKYELVNSWRDGDFMCFKASGFSTYIISGKKLDGNGNPVSTETTDTSKNPFTGIGISATGIILSAAVSAGILAFKKKKH